MKLSAKLDCDLVAVETQDELTLLVEVTAPEMIAAAPRQPATLQVVLDRSGSMGGDRLEGAKAALLALVDRLDPSDNLGVLAFDDGVQIVVPAGPLQDKLAVKQAIAAVTAGGTTDLSGGYLRGLQEARRVAGPAGATVLLVSDGHANAGITDADQIGTVATEARKHRITTSTLGFGLGYDELLLGALARGGAGNELFAEEADTAVALISGEVEGLLAQVAQAASLRVVISEHVASVHVLNDLPVVGLVDGVMLELGSFYAGETRRLLVKLVVPGIQALGLTQVASLEFTHVSLPDVLQHTTTVPIHVNVVPGDQAAGRIPDPEVRTEALFQQIQRSKRDASRLFTGGQVGQATEMLLNASTLLRSEADAMPVGAATELFAEADLLDALVLESHADASRAAKASSYDATVKSRNRGRESRGGRIVLRWVEGHEGVSAATITFEEWELQRLLRVLPQELSAQLRPTRSARGPEVADAIASIIGTNDPVFGFFEQAAVNGGFTVKRT